MKKISKPLSIVISLIILLGAIPLDFSFIVHADSPHQMIAYSQSDKRWGSHPYGYSNAERTIRATISSGGCGVLSLVNAIHYLNGTFIDPCFVADFSVSVGARVNGIGTSAETLCTKFAKQYGEEYNVAYDGVAKTRSDLINKLNAGCVSVSQSTSYNNNGRSTGGHVMAVVDYDSNTNKFLILDSAPSSNRSLDGASWQYLTESLYTFNNHSAFGTFHCLKLKYGTQSVAITTKHAATITGTDMTYPLDMPSGYRMPISGTISADRPLRYAGIFILKDKKVVQSKAKSYSITTEMQGLVPVEKSTKSISLSSDLSGIDTSTLAPGNYEYIIVTTCKYGKSFSDFLSDPLSFLIGDLAILCKKSFTVSSIQANSVSEIGLNSADFELDTQSDSLQKASKAGKYYGTMTTTVHEGGSSSDNGGSYNYYNGSDNYSTGSYKVTAKSGLYVRTGPGTNYDKAGGLSYGTVVDITQTSGNWGKCSSGWICLSYTSKVSSGSSGGLSYYNASSSYQTGYYTVITKAGLNVRSSYGANSSKVTAIPYGTQIAVEETNGNWGRCSRGWVCLDYTRYDGPIVPPVPVPDAPSLGLYSGADFAVGKAVTVKWEPAANAEVYDIWLKNSAGTVCQEIIGTNNNSASFTVNDAGTYYVTAQSRNSEHTSSASNSIKVTAHAPSTVTFADWDGTTISTQQVGYGETASAPTVPTRKGYTFSGWKGDFYTVNSDITITAEYVKNVYFVSFLDESGSLIGAKQRIEYGESASAPEYTAPEGYTFISWDKEFDFVESDLTIRPVNKWANENLPIEVLSASTAVRESGGYTVNVKIRNGSTYIKNGRIIVSLEANDDSHKMLAMTESAAFYILPSEGTGTSDRTIEIFVPYDNVAQLAKIYVVEKYSTAIPISNSRTINIDLSNSWTNWSINEPPEGALEPESRTEYSFRTRYVETFDKLQQVEGLIYDRTESKWGPYGNWSGWSDSYIGGNDSRQVETQQAVASYNYATNFHYYRYRNSSGEDGNHTYDSEHPIWQEIWLDYALKDPSWDGGYKWWHNGTNYHTMWKCGDWSDHYIASTNYKTQYRYRDRSLQYTYYYYRWSDWSAWGTTAYTETSDREVHTRTTYRYRMFDPSQQADTSGTSVTISGNVDPAFAGKQAILFIYKVDEASDYSNEYVGQSAIGQDGSYNFTFKMREMPSLKTGDFTATLGIEGTNSAIYLEDIPELKAPKAVYTVTYLDDDNNVLSTQSVTEGNDATAPQAPDKVGHDFICWNNTGKNVLSDLSIAPVYEPKTFTVVFIDDEKTDGKITIEKRKYGEPLAAPGIELTDDLDVVGWDRIIDGSITTEKVTDEKTGNSVDQFIVTDDLVLTAVYSPKTFTVEFLNENGDVLETQQVEYGQEAEAPASLDSDDALLLDWNVFGAEDNTYGTLDYVTNDMTVVPKFIFNENTDIPVASVESGEYSSAQTVILTCSTPDAVIYYTVDGSDPHEYGTEYTAPFAVNETSVIRYYASSIERNDSVENVVYIAINSSGTGDHLVKIQDEMFTDDESLFVKNNATLNLDLTKYEVEGYNLDGVYTDAEFTTKWNLTSPVTQSMTLYVKRSPKVFQVTFLGMDDEVLSEQEVEYLGVAEVPEFEDIEGYVFCGFGSTDYVITGDIEFTAVYVPEDEFVTISLNKEKVKLYKDTSFDLKATITPEPESDSEDMIMWSVSDESILSVNDDGRVLAVGTGQADVYATSVATGQVAICRVTVEANIDEKITIKPGVTIGFDTAVQLRGISAAKAENSVAQVKELFENDSLVFVSASGRTLTDFDLIGTGTVIKLINGETVLDEVTVVVTGDATGDGIINNRDAAMVTRYLVDKEYPSTAQLTAMDTNGDGKVNNRDASMLSRYLVGKEQIA